MLNQVALMGRLTRDPELKYTSGGSAVTSFTLAVQRNTNKDLVDYIDCTAWEKTAENISRYYRKGERMIVTGRMQIKTWKDNDGNNRKAAEVVVDHSYFVETKQRENTQNQPAPQGETFRSVDDEEDGELPF